MQALRQLGGGLILGLLSVVIVIGGISLALAEGYVPQPPPTPTETQPVFPSAPTETASSTSLIPSPTETATASPIPPTNCPPPSGWVLVMIQPGDTLEILAVRYRTTPEALMAANCLVSPILLPGYGIYVPPVPTITPIPCGAPYGWVQYIVQPGDSLYHISQLYRVTVSELQQANCLGNSTTIYTGQKLWVPNVPPSTPPVPATLTATPIYIEFDTVTPVPTDITPPTSTPEPPTPIPTEIPPSMTPPPTETPSPPTEPPPPTETAPPTTP
jgi:LysM repeat protein